MAHRILDSKARLAAVAAGAMALYGAFAPAADISSYAFVQPDGTLRVDGRTIRLYGIHIPQTEQACNTRVRPIRCAPRAALALEFKIQGFVRCRSTERNPDGSLVAVCRADGEDLSAYLLQRGWALALPDAPFEYVAFERIARHRHVGVWGLPVERIPEHPR